MSRVRFPLPARRPARRPWTLAIAVTALLLLLGAGVNTVIAKNIVCPFGTECVGGRKADTIRGEGQNNLYGKGGNDTITSAGNGSSVVDGGAGNDKIRAFVGFNIIAGGKGDDEINAVNDAVDDINCGGGKDKVFYDANVDITTNCEDRRPR